MSAIAWAIWTAAWIFAATRPMPDNPESYMTGHLATVFSLVGTGMLIWKTISP